MIYSEKCKINPKEEMIPDLGMGRFLVGYKSVFRMQWDGLGCVVTALVFLFLFFCIPFLFIKAKDIIYVLPLLLIPTLLFCSFVFIQRKNTGGSKHYRVYVFSDGFSWQEVTKKGSIIRIDNVFFIDVVDMKMQKIKKYVEHSFVTNYAGTDCFFKVIGKNDKNLFITQVTYRNEEEYEENKVWQQLAFDSIYKAWDISKY